MILDPHTIDPTTRALEAYIEASVEQLLRAQASPPQHGLLFLSAWHEAMPALVHLDPTTRAAGGATAEQGATVG